MSRAASGIPSFLVAICLVFSGAGADEPHWPSPTQRDLSEPPSSSCPIAAEEEEEEDEGKEEEGKTPDGKEKKGKVKGKEGEGEGEEEGKKGEDEKAEGKKAEKDEDGKIQLTREESEELRTLREPGLTELDFKKVREISKESPALMVTKPGGGKAPKVSKSAKKKVQIDSSRWGFVDLARRKKRIEMFYDKWISVFDRAAADEKSGEKMKENAEKQGRKAKITKNNELKEFNAVRCQMELQGNPKVMLRITSEDKQVQGGEKSLRDSIRSGLEGIGFKVKKEQPETWRGGRIPGYTFIFEGQPQSATEEYWVRKTYFLVPKAKGTSLVTFNCQAPKKVFDEDKAIELEFEAFIRGTQIQ
jgi:hypothetical protein